MNKPPAFQFYADDFLGGTQNLVDSEVGLYIRLLCAQWSLGGLPDDDSELASYGKGGTPVVRVKSKFKKCADGMLRNTRMEIERKKQKAFRKSRSENGKLGGRPRKASEKLVVLNGEAKKSSPSPSPSPSPKEELSDASLSLSVEVFNAWNEASKATSGGIPACLVMSDSRRRKLAVRVKDPFFAANWKSALEKVSKSEFCLGCSDRGWRASLDWFIQPDSAAKIMEGKYDSHIASKNSNRIGEKRIDRSIGTANEGISNQYKEFAARKAAGVGAVVKIPNA